MDTAVTLFKAFVYLIGFGSILFLTYITTRFIGSKANKVAKGKYISTVDSVTIGLNKQLHLIKVGEQFVLIASSGKNIEFLTNVSLDNFETEKSAVGNNRSNNNFDFKILFDKYFQSFKNKKADKQENDNTVDNTIDNGNGNHFVGSKGENFKNNLSRLKAIRSKIDKTVKDNGDEKPDEK